MPVILGTIPPRQILGFSPPPHCWQWQTDGVPVVDDKLLLEILLVAVLFALLTAALHSAARGWLRRRSQPEQPGWEPDGEANRSGAVRWARANDQRWDAEGTRRQHHDLAAEPDADFGLLATVAVVATATRAARLRRHLAEAGIRATTAIDRDGRHRVLVFASELYRARRIGGT